MDDFIMPDEETLEKLAEEYKKIKGSLLHPSVSVQSLNSTVSVLKHTAKKDDDELVFFAREIYNLQSELLYYCRGLLSRTYSEETVETVVSALTFKRKCAEDVLRLVVEPPADARWELSPSVGFKSLAVTIARKQLKLIKKINELTAYANCISTKRLIKDIKEGEILAHLHIAAVLL